MHKITISQKQASEIAGYIYKDIPAYIKEHHKEYTEYLNGKNGGIYV